MAKKKMLELHEDFDDFFSLSLLEIPYEDMEGKHVFNKVCLQFEMNGLEFGFTSSMSLDVPDAQHLRDLSDLLAKWADALEKHVGKNLQKGKVDIDGEDPNSTKN